ncbi:hypothetical protein FXE84_01005 [Vibrio cholerae]|uniref:hypothetical protein n=1 Tax=Vibrio cholerae TaxID=666 RepID=UPI0004E2F782|nr:hypothetical protein [Vibrio cholerae]KFE28792.1 hypothetical protein DN30_399 [Vibrio cholerae]TXY43944.1 hypothetical protein FXE84_01005 [Vibrio cholerae]
MKIQDVTNNRRSEESKISLVRGESISSVNEMELQNLMLIDLPHNTLRAKVKLIDLQQGEVERNEITH